MAAPEAKDYKESWLLKTAVTLRLLSTPVIMETVLDREAEK
jgi:hypothetical protein